MTFCEILLSTFYYHNKCENLLWQWRQGKASCLCSCLEQDLISIVMIQDLRIIASEEQQIHIWMTSTIMMLLIMLLLLTMMRVIMRGTCSGWQFLLLQPSWVRSPGRSKCGSDQESSNDCSDGDDDDDDDDAGGDDDDVDGGDDEQLEEEPVGSPGRMCHARLQCGSWISRISCTLKLNGREEYSDSWSLLVTSYWSEDNEQRNVKFWQNSQFRPSTHKWRITRCFSGSYFGLDLPVILTYL